jgi:hypothetical protein
VVRVIDQSSLIILKCSFGFLEGNAMLSLVGSSFPGIPLKAKRAHNYIVITMYVCIKARRAEDIRDWIGVEFCKDLAKLFFSLVTI